MINWQPSELKRRISELSHIHLSIASRHANSGNADFSRHILRHKVTAVDGWGHESFNSLVWTSGLHVRTAANVQRSSRWYEEHSSTNGGLSGGDRNGGDDGRRGCGGSGKTARASGGFNTMSDGVADDSALMGHRRSHWGAFSLRTNPGRRKCERRWPARLSGLNTLKTSRVNRRRCGQSNVIAEDMRRDETV